jgi:FAD/FMN-containing dehydrogenase
MAFVRTISQPGVIAQLRVLGGAMARVPDEATAFAHRDAGMMFTIISGWEDPVEGPSRHAWVNAFWRAIRPYSAGVYVNFLEDEGEERVREAYKPATYERLVAIKNRYDPTNVFHLNQNIAPTR